MIYTVTFNPTLDYILRIEDFEQGKVNRVQDVKLLCGGKGINVSWVLHNLKVENIALGFLAGFTGHEIERMMQEHGCQTDFLFLKNGISRINVKLIEKIESELNAPGPPIDGLDKLFEKLDALGEEDILVLAGSLPEGVPADTYELMLARLDHAKCVVDTTGEALRRVLKYKPFLIKPNHHELGELFGRSLHTQEEIIECAQALQKEGAQNILVSMAGDGALFVGKDGRILACEAPKGELKGSTGAGDSMVAGFLAGYTEKHDFEHAFYMGIAAGSASAFSVNLATKEEIHDILGKIEK